MLRCPLGDYEHLLSTLSYGGSYSTITISRVFGWQIDAALNRLKLYVLPFSSSSKKLSTRNLIITSERNGYECAYINIGNMFLKDLKNRQCKQRHQKESRE